MSFRAKAEVEQSQIVPAEALYLEDLRFLICPPVGGLPATLARNDTEIPRLAALARNDNQSDSSTRRRLARNDSGSTHLTSRLLHIPISFNLMLCSPLT